MEIQLTPEQDSFVHLGIQEGRYGRAEDAVQEALARWVDRERARLELLMSLREAEASIDAGGGIELDSDGAIRRFTESVMQRGRARLRSSLLQA